MSSTIEGLGSKFVSQWNRSLSPCFFWLEMVKISNPDPDIELTACRFVLPSGGNAHWLRAVRSVHSDGDKFYARSRSDFDGDRRPRDAKMLCYQRNEFCVCLPIHGWRSQICYVRSVFSFFQKVLTRTGANFNSNDRHVLALRQYYGAKRQRSDSPQGNRGSDPLNSLRRVRRQYKSPSVSSQ